MCVLGLFSFNGFRAAKSFCAAKNAPRGFLIPFLREQNHWISNQLEKRKCNLLTKTEIVNESNKKPLYQNFDTGA